MGFNVELFKPFRPNIDKTTKQNCHLTPALKTNDKILLQHNSVLDIGTYISSFYRYESLVSDAIIYL